MPHALCKSAGKAQSHVKIHLIRSSVRFEMICCSGKVRFLSSGRDFCADVEGGCGDGVLAADGACYPRGACDVLGARGAAAGARAARGGASSAGAVPLVVGGAGLRVHVLGGVLLPLLARPARLPHAGRGGNGAGVAVHHRRLRSVQRPGGRQDAHAARRLGRLRRGLRNCGLVLALLRPRAALRGSLLRCRWRRGGFPAEVLGEKARSCSWREGGAAVAGAGRGWRRRGSSCTPLGQASLLPPRLRIQLPLLVLLGMQLRHLRHAPIRPRGGRPESALHRREKAMTASPQIDCNWSGLFGCQCSVFYLIDFASWFLRCVD
jgi:hypothetical protein